MTGNSSSDDTTRPGSETPSAGALSERLDALAATNEALRAENEELRERVEALEKKIQHTDERSNTTQAGSDTLGDVPVLLTSGGQNTKVIGEISDTNGIGVLGNATGDGAAEGVRGVTQSSDTGAAAVNAEARASSGETYGVRARTQSDNAKAAAVDARAPNARSNAVRADTTGGYGNALFATVDSENGLALRAEQQSSASNARAIDASTMSSDAPAVRAAGAGGGAFKALGTVIINDDTEQKTAGPIAKGFISADTSTVNAVNVASVTRTGTDNKGYRIDIDNIDYVDDEYAAMVTTKDSRFAMIGQIGASPPRDLVVNIYDSNSNQVDGAFQFVIYDLPNGTVTT
jgi:cell division septum initiation protein DivIVA